MSDLPGTGRVIKRFRVAREGQTVDGRTLTRQEIIDMASTYNPAEYGARINIEHISGYSPTPPFNAYGDVVLADHAIEDGLACLYNTVSALPNFIDLNKAGQKIYPSIEFIRDFAGSGKAYQVGLAMTDTPASRGTEPAKFSSNGYPLIRTVPSTEIFLMNTTQNQTPAAQTEEKSLLATMKEIFTPKQQDPAPASNAELLAATATAVGTIASSLTTLSKSLQAMQKDIDDLKKAAAADAAEDATEGTQQQSSQNTNTQPPAAGQPPATNQAASTPEQRMSAIETTLQQLLTTLNSQPANSQPPLVHGGGVQQNTF